MSMNILGKKNQNKLKILFFSQYFWPENFRINELVDYLSKKNFESYVFGISENKRKQIQEIADGSCINKNENELGVKNFLSTQEIVTQVELKIILEKSYNVYDTSCKYYQDMASDIHTIEPRSYEDFFVLPLYVDILW